MAQKDLISEPSFTVLMTNMGEKNEQGRRGRYRAYGVSTRTSKRTAKKCPLRFPYEAGLEG